MESKETTYPDDSLEFHTRLHIPYNPNINQGCDILEQDIPDVVISQVYICPGGRGETHVSVHCPFINLMNGPNEFLRARRTSIIRKKQKEMQVPAISLEKTAFDMSETVRVRTVNLLVPSVRRSHSSYLLQQLENKRFQ